MDESDDDLNDVVDSADRTFGGDAHDVYEELGAGAMDLYESDVPDLLKAGEEEGEEREQFGANEDGGYCAKCRGSGSVVICVEEVCSIAGVCFHDGGTVTCPSCGGQD